MGLCCSDREKQNTPEKSRNSLSRNDWFTLFAIGSVHFASAICISIQAPFYPQEAESKNATSTQYGLVFGIYELVSFISSPLLGNYINVIGAKLLLNSGIVLAAACSISFGLLDLVTTHTSFIALSFLIRMFEALGSAAAVTSAFAITAAVFPDNIATTFATLEIFYGLGHIAGPMIGGFLYTLGGYILPFVVMGSVLLLDGIFVYFILPSYKKDKPKPKASIIEIFKVPAVIIDSFSIMGTSIAMGFYSATLEPHIREFGLLPIYLGLIFVISGGTYACTAPLVGRLCDYGANPKSIILVGSVFVVIGVFFLGPAPFLPISPTLHLVIIGQIFQGLGMSCILVSGFIDAIRSAVSGGFPDEISTYGLMSGLWSASFSLGDFIGPSVAGALNDLVGFRLGSMFIVAVHTLIFITMGTYMYKTRKTKREGYEKVAIFTVGASDKKNTGNNITDLESNCNSKIEGPGYGSLSNGKAIKTEI